MGTRNKKKGFRKTRSKRQRGGEQSNLIRSDDDIKTAVNLWCSNRAEAETKYGHISAWDVSSVTNMKELFRYKETFNDDISRWDVSQVTDMSNMFLRAESFNQLIGNWDVSKVTNMGSMFYGSAFNQPIGDWDVSSVTNMGSMFYFNIVFDADISRWDVSNVTNMRGMFSDAEAFSQPIGDWNVSNVTNMGSMFGGTYSFNQDISGWIVSKVTAMNNMFHNAYAFNQDISGWDVSNVTDMKMMFAGFSSSISTVYTHPEPSKARYRDRQHLRGVQIAARNSLPTHAEGIGSDEAGNRVPVPSVLSKTSIPQPNTPRMKPKASQVLSWEEGQGPQISDWLGGKRKTKKRKTKKRKTKKSNRK